MKILCFGDSNTYGYDPRDYLGDCYAPQDRWVDILADKTGWIVENHGLNGRQVPLRPVQFTQEPDLLLIMLGTNDLLQGLQPDEIANRMARLLTSCGISREKLLVIAPPLLQMGQWVTEQALVQRSAQLGAWYQALCAKLSIRFVDAGCWNIALCFGGVHFTESGHRTFANKLYQYLKKEYSYAGSWNESTGLHPE